MHFNRPLNCWSLRCSWSNACRRCSNYIFILHLTLGFNILRKDNCKPRWETFKFWDLVQLILENVRYVHFVLDCTVSTVLKIYVTWCRKHCHSSLLGTILSHYCCHSVLIYWCCMMGRHTEFMCTHNYFGILNDRWVPLSSDRTWGDTTPGLILGLHPANERQRYKVTPTLIGWVKTQNQPCIPSRHASSWFLSLVRDLSHITNPLYGEAAA